jgi:high-affinity Fe2+/Pb2+ permease
MAVAALGLAPGAWAQGCVLCYTSLVGSGPTAMHAFQMAMFALLIPALLLFLAVFLLIFRRARTKVPVRPTSRNRVVRLGLSASAKPVEGRA